MMALLELWTVKQGREDEVETPVYEVLVENEGQAAFPVITVAIDHEEQPQDEEALAGRVGVRPPGGRDDDGGARGELEADSSVESGS